MKQPETNPNAAAEALLRSREQFYDDVDITTDPIFCGDERPSEYGKYIHVFGGPALNAAYNLRICEEAMMPGTSMGATFAFDVADVTPKLVAMGVTPGVHSSEKAEGGKDFAADASDDIDCGYAQKRAAISRGIALQAAEVLAEARRQEPALFSRPDNAAFAEDVVGAHNRIGNYSEYFSTGREVAQVALDNGAISMTVQGDHSGVDGIRNKQVGSSLDSTAANLAGMPTYEHDVWAMDAIYGKLQIDQTIASSDQLRIADLIDSIGTMRALGVTTIATRD